MEQPTRPSMPLRATDSRWACVLTRLISALSSFVGYVAEEGGSEFDKRS